MASPQIHTKEKNTDGHDLFGSLQLEEGILSHQAAQHIRELVQSGGLRVGDRLPPERELGERLGVSRTVVREAIQILRAEGLVRIRMGVGSFVTQSAPNILEGPMSHLRHSEAKKIQDLMQVRSIIEPAIAMLSAEHALPVHIKRMEQAIADMDLYISDGHRYIERDNHFHIALAEASNNSVYLLLINSVVDLLQENRRLAISVPGAAKRANGFHRRILEAVRAREPKKAFAAMEGHMEQMARDVRTAMHDD
jgi:GntR family transcriptional regulator, transcriptional repressor for pyruvate dehydrogenase complex